MPARHWSGQHDQPIELTAEHSENPEGSGEPHLMRQRPRVRMRDVNSFVLSSWQKGRRSSSAIRSASVLHPRHLGNPRDRHSVDVAIRLKRVGLQHSADFVGLVMVP